MTEKATYPAALRIFRRRHNEMEMISTVMDQLPTRVPPLGTATTCLSLGTGYGQFDIEFIKRCLPNLKRFIAVEKDEDCVKELKMNLNKTFNSSLIVEIHHTSIEQFLDTYQGWADKNETVSEDSKFFKLQYEGKIDVVLALHVIYFLKELDRRRLYNMCFDHWLSSAGKGHFVFMNADENNAIVQLLDQLKNHVHPFLSSKTIKEELKSIGINVLTEINYKCPINMADYDVDLYRMFTFNHKNSEVSEEMITKAMAIVAPDGWNFNSCDLCVCSKKNE